MDRVLLFAIWMSDGGYHAGTVDLLAQIAGVVCGDVLEYCGDVSFADEVTELQWAPQMASRPDVVFEPMDCGASPVSATDDPVRAYRDSSGDRSAIRLSDLVGDPVPYWRHIDRSFERIHLEQHYGAFLPYLLTVRVARPKRPDVAFSIVRGTYDFSCREVRLLESLRPFLSLHERLKSNSADEHSARSPCGLTERENEVLDHVARGATNREIAVALTISPHTVRTHLQHVFEKLDVSTRTAALARTDRTVAA